MIRPLVLALLLGPAALLGCDGVAGTAWTWALPDHFPEPYVPPENPMTEEKVRLGERLFFDTRLSLDGTYACASCHDPARAFTDGLAQAKGVTGDLHPRGAMALSNVAWVSALGWANPLLSTLEKQALVPMFGEHPLELGLVGREDQLYAALAADAQYPRQFEEAFPDDPAIDLQTIVDAIASYERSLVSADAPYDRWIAGDSSAMSSAAQRGLALFKSERLECFHCHGGFLFSDAVRTVSSRAAESLFHQTGLYDLDGQGAYPPGGAGLAEISGKPEDTGRFRAPSLRNIAVTAPYMHDGSLATLDDVLDHYSQGGRAASDRTSPLLFPFTLTPDERADMHALFDALTDPSFLARKAP
jgi:cytochrome c peroxidase